MLQNRLILGCLVTQLFIQVNYTWLHFTGLKIKGDKMRNQSIVREYFFRIGKGNCFGQDLGQTLEI